KVALTGASLRAVGSGAAARLMKQRGLTSSSYHAGLRILDQEEDEADRAIRVAIEDAATVGAASVSLSAGPRGERSFSAADRIYVARLRRVAPLAQKLRVGLGIEPLHPLLCANGYIHTLRHGAEIAAQVEGAQLVADTAHLFWDRELDADIARHVDLIGLV